MKSSLTRREQQHLRELLATAKGHTERLTHIERLISVTLGLDQDPTGVVTDAVTAGWSLETLLHELDIAIDPEAPPS